MISTRDREEIAGLGFDAEAIELQLQQFKNGFPFLHLSEPATPSSGIMQVDASSMSHYISEYEGYEGSRVKFVPASGAATRMFKSLYEAKTLLEEGAPRSKVFEKFKDVDQVFQSIGKFAFFEELKEKAAGLGIDLANIKDGEFASVLGLILSEEGLNYGNLPKGLIKFHRYESGSRTAAAEHLAEGAAYAKDSSGRVRIHFTVSPQHLEPFKHEVNAAVKAFAGGHFEVDFSVQKPATDTIAVDLDNQPFRDAKGNLVFRPAGHGALIENLNEIDADLIFIKNIDNVVPDSLKADTITYKKVIAGLLVDAQHKIFRILHAVEAEALDTVSKEIHDILRLIGADVSSYESLGMVEKRSFLFNALNRPIRVCGMVKNQGEPGGGPFVAKNGLGTYSLQIVESSQIDLKNPEQKAIFDRATHFNPVDLVCGVKDYRGKKFDLRKFRDSATGFISIKSKDGRDLKAMELPGLWNGAMSNWITLFVEVPLITFNPVKTINDLLRDEHQ